MKEPKGRSGNVMIQDVCELRFISRYLQEFFIWWNLLSTNNLVLTTLLCLYFHFSSHLIDSILAKTSMTVSAKSKQCKRWVRYSWASWSKDEQLSRFTKCSSFIVSRTSEMNVFSDFTFLSSLPMNCDFLGLHIDPSSFLIWSQYNFNSKAEDSFQVACIPVDILQFVRM